jgi:hypothetical protein
MAMRIRAGEGGSGRQRRFPRPERDFVNVKGVKGARREVIVVVSSLGRAEQGPDGPKGVCHVWGSASAACHAFGLTLSVSSARLFHSPTCQSAALCQSRGRLQASNARGRQD